jgi:hypothetical protein
MPSTDHLTAAINDFEGLQRTHKSPTARQMLVEVFQSPQWWALVRAIVAERIELRELTTRVVASEPRELLPHD